MEDLMALGGGYLALAVLTIVGVVGLGLMIIEATHRAPEKTLAHRISAGSSSQPVVRNLDVRPVSYDTVWPISAEDHPADVIVLDPALVRALYTGLESTHPETGWEARHDDADLALADQDREPLPHRHPASEAHTPVAA